MEIEMFNIMQALKFSYELSLNFSYFPFFMGRLSCLNSTPSQNFELPARTRKKIFIYDTAHPCSQCVNVCFNLVTQIQCICFMD